MTYLKNKINNWLNSPEKDDYVKASAYSSPIDTNRIASSGINFSVHKASGGFVIETRHYDINTDRQHNGLYVVTDEADLGREISKIITMECLKR